MHFDWRNGKKNGIIIPGLGSYDTTKAITHLRYACSGGGKDCDEVTAHNIATEAKKKRKIEVVSGNLKQYLIDKLVILRMNLKFMIYCRGKHGSIGKVNEVQNDIGNDEDIYVDEYD